MLKPVTITKRHLRQKGWNLWLMDEIRAGIVPESRKTFTAG